MTVYVVICGDHDDVWVHGVYATKKQAARVFDRLTGDTYHAVRMQPQHVREPAADRAGAPREGMR